MNAYQFQQWESIQAGMLIMKEPEFQTPRLQELLIDLKSAHKAIDKLYMAQLHEQKARSDGAMIEQLRVALRKNHLLRISKDAGLYLEGLPGVDDFFHVPHKRVKDSELLDASDRILANAREHEAVFIARRYPKDFIAKAQAAADALRNKLADPNTVVSRRSTATFALKPAIKRGRKVMDAIDRNVAVELSENALALSQWARAYRVPKKLGRPKNNRRGRQIYPPPD